jgi:hypothetical protein
MSLDARAVGGASGMEHQLRSAIYDEAGTRDVSSCLVDDGGVHGSRPILIDIRPGGDLEHLLQRSERVTAGSLGVSVLRAGAEKFDLDITGSRDHLNRPSAAHLANVAIPGDARTWATTRRRANESR